MDSDHENGLKLIKLGLGEGVTWKTRNKKCNSDPEIGGKTFIKKFMVMLRAIVVMIKYLFMHQIDTST